MSEPMKKVLGLQPGYASEEEIAAAHALLLDRLADSLHGQKLNAVFSALLRISGALDADAHTPR